MDWLRDRPLTPLLKWPGGKSDELRLLRTNCNDLFPTRIERYFEPFLGGGAFWLAINADCPKFVNDTCTDLIGLYTRIKARDKAFFQSITQMTAAWDSLHECAQANWERLYGTSDIDGDVTQDLGFPSLGMNCHQTIARVFARKMKRVKLIEARKGEKLDAEGRKSNIESALKAGYYTYIRNAFNQLTTGPLREAAFYFLRDFCYSSMFRYNSQGDFNVPYGGVSYNRRSPSYRVEYWKSPDLSDHLETTMFGNVDFETFLDEYRPTKRDFAFIDPPYDTDFSTYDKKVFGQKEQERLATYLIGSEMHFIAVMKYTPRIYSLYKTAKNIKHLLLSKNFAVSFRDRNDRNVNLLMVVRIIS